MRRIRIALLSATPPLLAGTGCGMASVFADAPWVPETWHRVVYVALFTFFMWISSELGGALRRLRASTGTLVSDEPGIKDWHMIAAWVGATVFVLALMRVGDYLHARH